MQNSSYTLLDFGNGKRLEQWGPYRLIRPDPTATGQPSASALWATADARYEGEKGRGQWSKKSPLPAQWDIVLDDIRMQVRLAPYKHTGVFPEQQSNWQWMRHKVQNANRKLNVLNLFAYTGGATVALAKDGHHVTHVDAAKPTIGWAKENAQINDIAHDRLRWMVDDVPTFVARERKRGKQYDAMILDPPAYGHGPNGTSWRVERDLAPLLENCVALLSPSPAFMVLNGYAHGDTPESLQRLLSAVLLRNSPHKKFRIDAAELFLTTPHKTSLSTGIVARCAFKP